MKCTWCWFKILKKYYFGCNCNELIGWPFFEQILKCLFVVQSKYLSEDSWCKKNSWFIKSIFFSHRLNKWLKIIFCPKSAVALVGVKIWHAHVKAFGMRMRKLVLGLSVAQILLEKINKTLSSNKLGFIDVNRTVHRG